MHERTAEKNWPTNSNLVLLRFTQAYDKLKFIGHKAPGEELALATLGKGGLDAPLFSRILCEPALFSQFP
jgi:hypothetical protein